MKNYERITLSHYHIIFPNLSSTLFLKNFSRKTFEVPFSFRDINDSWHRGKVT